MQLFSEVFFDIHVRERLREAVAAWCRQSQIRVVFQAGTWTDYYDAIAPTEAAGSELSLPIRNAQAAIAAALEACAMRAREAEAAFEAGGEAAVDAAEADPEESFFAVSELGDPYRGELLAPVGIGEYVPFVAGEAHWHKAGAEMPAELARIEAENERRGRGAGKALARVNSR